jgi:hypothetical protein
MWQVPMRRRRQRRRELLAMEEGRAESPIPLDGVRLAREKSSRRLDEMAEPLTKVTYALAISLIDP